jgi:mannose-1-phosphate guanylyltransferase
VNQAVEGSVALGGRPILLAAKPDSLELEYGWIKPGRVLGRVGTAAIHAVHAFIEKPDEGMAREARATGSLWNTMVLAAKGKELWRLGQKCFPEMMFLFERLKAAIDTAEVLRVLDTIYEAMPCRNFSSHLLQYMPEQLAVLEMRDVLWSDWGNSERLLSGLEKFGKRSTAVEDSLPFLYAG